MRAKTHEFIRTRMIVYPFIFLVLFLIFSFDVPDRLGRDATILIIFGLALIIIIFSSWDWARLRKKYRR